MERLYVYEVNGTTFEDYEAFGEAWHMAKALAKKEHTCIERTVVCGDNISHEYYSYGMFVRYRGIEDFNRYAMIF